MDKAVATVRLGGTEEEAARWIGISVEHYREWAERLWPSQADRVLAAILKRELARAMGQTHKQFHADWRGEAALESLITRVSICAVMANLLPGGPPPDLARRPDERRRYKPRKAAGSEGVQSAITG